MKRKLTIILTTLLLLSTSISAQDKAYMVLHLKDGSQVMWSIAEKPKITFQGGTMSVETQDFLVSNIKKYTLEDADYTGIGGVASGNAEAPYHFNGQELMVRPQGDAKNVKLFGANGVEVAVPVKQASNGLLHFDLKDQPAGVYLLQVGQGETIKIMKK